MTYSVTKYLSCQPTVVIWHLASGIIEIGMQCNGNLGYGLQIVGSCKSWAITNAGTVEAESTQKKGYKLPRAPMTNSDLTRLINSDEVQSVVRPKKTVRLLLL